MYQGKDYEGNIVKGEIEYRSDGTVWIGSWKGNKSVWVACKVNKDSIKKIDDEGNK